MNPKYFYKTFLWVSIPLIGVSCSKEEFEEVTEDRALSVTTSIDGMNTRSGAKDMFAVNDQIGLFVCKENTLTPYQTSGNYNNVKATYNGSWVMDENVYLGNDLATIWAYYPYNSTVTSMRGLPLDMTQQIDYMYGTSVNNSLNNQNPEANLSMKHICAQLRFSYQTSGNVGEGKLVRLELANKKDEIALPTKGSFDAEMNLLLRTEHGSIVLENVNGLVNANTDEYVSMLVLPSTQENLEGKIELRIDAAGRSYACDFPDTKWVSGKVYHYTIFINDKFGLSLGDASIEPWDDSNDISTIIPFNY